MNIYKSIIYGSILSMSLASEMVNAEPVDCSSGFCEVSNATAKIQVNPLTAPAIIDDGFGFKQKTPGGLRKWEVNGVNHIFSQWNWFRIGNESSEISPDDIDFNNFHQNASATQDDDTDTISLVYENPESIKIEILYRLSGEKVFKDVRVTNNNPSEPKNLAWIEYTDLDLGGNQSGDATKGEHVLAHQQISTVITQIDLKNEADAKVNWVAEFQTNSPQGLATGSEFGAFSGRLVEFGGPKNILDSLLDDEVTNLEKHSISTVRYFDPIHAVQYNFPIVTDQVLISSSLVLLPKTSVRPLQGTIRDFNTSNSGSVLAHPDFQQGFQISDLGIVELNLGLDNKPVYAGQPDTPTTNGADNFNLWFNDNSTYNESRTFDIFATNINSNGILTFLANPFFPIDGSLLSNEGRPHNSHFTFGTHSTFRYQGGERLSYASDDDLWVFINGVLAVDLGGIHTRTAKTIFLDDFTESLGIEPGNVYSFDLFFAERQTSSSVLRFDIPKLSTAIGDVDGNNCIDRNDLNEVIVAVRSRSIDLKFDINNDGVVSIADARKLVTLFTNSRGATCIVQATWNSEVQVKGNWTDSNWVFEPSVGAFLYPNNNGTRFNAVINGLYGDGVLVTVTEDVDIEGVKINPSTELHIENGAFFKAKTVNLSSEGSPPYEKLVIAGSGSSLIANTVTASGLAGIIRVGGGTKLVARNFTISGDDWDVWIYGTFIVLDGNYFTGSSTLTAVYGLLEVRNGNLGISLSTLVSGRIEVSGELFPGRKKLRVSGVIAANKLSWGHSDFEMVGGGSLQIGGNLKNPNIEPSTLTLKENGVLRIQGIPDQFDSFNGKASFVSGGEIAFEIDNISTLSRGDTIILFTANKGINADLNTLDVTVNGTSMGSTYSVFIEDSNKLVLKVL